LLSNPTVYKTTVTKCQELHLFETIESAVYILTQITPNQIDRPIRIKHSIEPLVDYS